jgi:predicted MFS family arabinose efflux permease
VPLRLRIPASIVAATVVSTVVFSATPFLVKSVAAEFDVGIGAAGALSTVQLGGFVVASWFAGRYLRPRRRVLTAAALLGVVANLHAALTPWFAALAVDRFASGVSLGLVAWIAWAEVFGDDERVGDVAVIGPVVGMLASPAIALLLDGQGTTALFAALAVLNLVPLVFVRATRFDVAPAVKRRRHPAGRSTMAILACLGALTFGGSSIFVFAGSIGSDLVGMAPLAVSLAFSANSIAGVPTARFRGTRHLAGAFLAITAVAALVIGLVHHPVAFWLAMVAWGAAFWMGIPGAFALLASRSLRPDERAGDAQSVMALGRVFGPLMGGLLYDGSSSAALGLAAGGIMLAASGALLYVEWRIRPMSFDVPLAIVSRWRTDPAKDAR